MMPKITQTSGWEYDRAWSDTQTSDDPVVIFGCVLHETMVDSPSLTKTTIV